MTTISAKMMSAAAVLSLGLMATPAHAQFFGQTVDNNTVIGGLAGAGIGGAIGSNIAGSGNRDEGTAIGALVGGLAGASIGNARSDYYGNPYAGSYNPGFNGRNLLGAGIGAGLGGVIGSNLAGSGVQEEGTALGALIGGVAGYAIANRRAGGAWNGYGGYNAPAYGGGYGYRNAGYALPAPVYYSQPAAPVYRPAPTYYAPTTTSFGGYVAGPVYANSTTSYVQPARTVSPTYTLPTTTVSPSYSYSTSALPVVSSTTSHYYSNGSGHVGGLRHGERVVGYSSGCYSSC